MVSTEGDTGEYYCVGVPDEVLMRIFDGLERVPESELPNEFDVLHVDAGFVSDLFKSKKHDV